MTILLYENHLEFVIIKLIIGYEKEVPELKKTRKLLAAILCIISFIHMFPCVYADDEWGAQVQLGKQIKADGISVNMTTAGRYPAAVVKSGKECWPISAKEWFYNTLYVNVLKRQISGSGGRRVYVEVEYFDDSEDGWFQIVYNNRDKKEKRCLKQRINGTNSWKTAGFVLDAPSMRDDMNGGDFQITTKTVDDFSHSTVYIHSVRIKQLDEISSAAVELDMSDRVGNIYFSDEDCEFKINISNKATQSYSADINLKVYDYNGNEIYTQTEKTDLNSMRSTTENIKLDFDRFGVFTLYAEVVNKGKGYCSYTTIPFSRVRKSEFKNERFGACNHFGWGQKWRDVDKIFGLMQKAGIGWSREDVLWRSYEVEKGQYKLDWAHKRFLEKLDDYDIDQLLILNEGNKLYTKTDSHVPHTEEEVAAFKKYVTNVVKDLKKYGVDTFEYWNEYDHGSKIKYGTEYDYYVKLAQATWEAIQEGNPEATAIGFTSASTGVALIKPTFDQGGYKYMNDVSYHMYPEGSPDKSKVDEDTRSVRELINQYPGGEDMKIWLTEMGWSTAKYDMEAAASYLGKEFAMQLEDGLTEVMFWYDFMDDGHDPTAIEHVFGMVNQQNAQKEVSMGAKPAYVAAAAMNGLMGTPDYVEKTMLNDNSVYAYHYKRRQDNKDTAVVWGIEENNSVLLDLGANDVTFYDFYGNPLQVISNNGTYSLTVDDEPVYAVGDFGGFKQGENGIFISETNISAAENDKINVYLYKTADEKLDIDISTENTELISLGNTPEFDGKTARAELIVNGKIGDMCEIPVSITDRDKHVVFSAKIKITVVEALKVEGRTRLYRDTDAKRWQMEFNIKSNYHTEFAKASLWINSPEEFSGSKYDLGELYPNRVNTVRVHLPKIPAFTSYKLKAKIVLTNGYSADFEMPIDFAAAYRAGKSPEIDGVLSKDEWNQNGRITSSRADQVELLKASDKWNGTKDLSSNTYLMWDDEYLYIAVEVTDDVFSCNYTGSNIWQGDSVQFGLSYTLGSGNSGNAFTEVGMALTSKGSEVVKYSSESGTTMDIKDSKVAVIRKDNKTVYELKIPWTEAVPKNAVISENTEIGFSMLVNDNDGKGRRGWIEFGSGIGRYKAVNEFARIRLLSEG